MKPALQLGLDPISFNVCGHERAGLSLPCFWNSLAGCELDREVGDMRAQGIPNVSKLFTYMRYNAELSEKGLSDLGLKGIRPEDVQSLDSIDHIAEMQEVGKAVAKQVHSEHFAGF